MPVSFDFFEVYVVPKGSKPVSGYLSIRAYARAYIARQPEIAFEPFGSVARCNGLHAAVALGTADGAGPVGRNVCGRAQRTRFPASGVRYA